MNRAFDSRGNTRLRFALRVALLFVALFLAAFLTRLPAIYFASIYALHGVLAAPFFAAIATLNVRKGGVGWEFVAALAVLAAVLGAMSPVMGLGFAIVAIVYAGAWFGFAGISMSKRAVTCGALLGLACYAAPVCLGIAFGSYMVTGGSAPQIALLALVSIALGAGGAYACKGTGVPSK